MLNNESINKQISIIIVTWNNEDIINSCLKSIVKYIPGAEVIVSDSNSTDRTLELVKSNFPTVKVVASNTNIGFARANNEAFKFVTNNNIIFMNPDVILKHKGVEKLFSYLDDSVGLVSCKFLNSDGTVQSSCFNFDNVHNLILEQFKLLKIFPERVKRKYAPYLSRHDKIMYPDWIVGAFLCMKKETFQKINGFSEDYFLYSEDMDLAYKIRNINQKALFYPNYEVLHIGGQSEKKDQSSSKLKKLMDSKKVFSIKYSKKNNLITLKYCYLVKYKIAWLLSPLNIASLTKLYTKYKSVFLYLKSME